MRATVSQSRAIVKSGKVGRMRFFRLVLRTIDAASARTFYDAVLGDHAFQIFPLHEQAIARGARPHWLGYVEVDNVARATQFFTSRGATPLGPSFTANDGTETAIFRDPGGAVVALAKPSQPDTLDLPWISHYTNDLPAAKANYGELCGWSFAAPLDLGELGVYHPFAFAAGGAIVGAFSALRPGVRPHWLFHHRVNELEAAMAVVTNHGGSAHGPICLPSGARVAICEDREGAVFALHSSQRLQAY
jgi:predicted enzyme related to lactoylglutathione lyase